MRRVATVVLALLLCAGAANAQCPTPIIGPVLTFPPAVSGAAGAFISFPVPAGTTAVAIGPNFSAFVAVGIATVQFLPNSQACGAVTGSLIIQDVATGCPLVVFDLQGTAFSLACVLNLATTAPLTAGGRDCAINSLLLATATTNALTRCAALRCAECCVLSDLALGRDVGALLAAIQALEAAFGCARVR